MTANGRMPEAEARLGSICNCSRYSILDHQVQVPVFSFVNPAAKKKGWSDRAQGIAPAVTT
jgi:hypothetical protein